MAEWQYMQSVDHYIPEYSMADERCSQYTVFRAPQCIYFASWYSNWTRISQLDPTTITSTWRRTAANQRTPQRSSSSASSSPYWSWWPHYRWYCHVSVLTGGVTSAEITFWKQFVRPFTRLWHFTNTGGMIPNATPAAANPLRRRGDASTNKVTDTVPRVYLSVASPPSVIWPIYV